MDYYSILECTYNSTPDEIKRQYKKLAMKYHPDKGGDKDKFQKLNEAFEVIGNQEKRKVYDNRHNQSPLFGNIFESFFPGFKFPHETSRQQENSTIKLAVSLEDIYMGKQTSLNISRKDCCVKCCGLGCTSFETCSACLGLGKIKQSINISNTIIQQIITNCEECKGEGKVMKDKCDICNASGLIEQSINVDIKIARGTRNNEKMILSQYGNYNKRTKQIDDLILIVKEKHHRRYKRNGNDLYLDLNISVGDAIRGFNFSFVHLNKNSYVVECRSVINSEKKGVISGLGMPYKKDYGNLYINFIINYPLNIIETLDDLKPNRNQYDGEKVVMTLQPL